MNREAKVVFFQKKLKKIQNEAGESGVHSQKEGLGVSSGPLEAEGGSEKGGSWLSHYCGYSAATGMEIC